MESIQPVLGMASLQRKSAPNGMGSEPERQERGRGSIPSLQMEEHTFREARSPAQSHIRGASLRGGVQPRPLTSCDIELNQECVCEQERGKREGHGEGGGTGKKATPACVQI